MTTNFERLSASLSDRYRIERELGQGGMATVYLARDLKHDRQVAIKVLRPELAAVIGADRFLSEIKTTANLQHPHILSLFDSGAIDGTVFYVMPFVDGESLRDRLTREKQLPIADAVRIATETADALEYAHQHGVIHRDIKPENILLHGGHALVADFGIALAASKTGGARMTETGMSLGTPQYMSPEQAMGERELDARTDVYALGCTTYEMLTGEPPFTGPTAQAIVAKVMTAEPVDAATLRKSIPPHVADAVHTAMQKLPADRFATAQALADALRSAGTGHHRSGAASIKARRTGLASVARAGVMLGAAALAVGAGFVLGRRASGATDYAHMLMQQRTYRIQSIFTARYASSGRAFVYSAAESGNTPRIYLINDAYPEPRSISDSAIQLLAVSSHDELAVLIHAQYEHHRVFTGTLARMPLGGGTPRELVKGVRDADWSPDGSQLAIVRVVNGRDRLEYPVGTALYETAGYLSDLRIAPDGMHIGFNEHPEKLDDRGFVAVVDLHGKHAVLTEQFSSIEGLAWAPDGSLVFGAQPAASVQQLERVTLGGRVERSAPGIGDATIQDIAPDGRRLILREDRTSSVWFQRANTASVEDLSWLNLTFFPILSGDGAQLIFGDGSNLAGDTYGTMLRRTDGSPAVRLGAGAPLGVSLDKQWVLSSIPSEPVQLVAYPTGVGTSRRLDHGEFSGITAAAFVGGGNEYVVCGNAPKSAVRCYVGSAAGGALRPFLSASVRRLLVSPDGASVVVNIADSGYRRVLLRDGSSQPVPGLTADDEVLRFSPDGKELWTREPDALPVRAERVNLETGRRSALIPPFAIGRPALVSVSGVSLADDPRTYAYIDRTIADYLFELTVKR